MTYAERKSTKACLHPLAHTMPWRPGEILFSPNTFSLEMRGWLRAGRAGRSSERRAAKQTVRFASRTPIPIVDRALSRSSVLLVNRPVRSKPACPYCNALGTRRPSTKSALKSPIHGRCDKVFRTYEGSSSTMRSYLSSFSRALTKERSRRAICRWFSQCGDGMMRALLYEAAQVMLTPTIKWSWLKAWAQDKTKPLAA